MRAVMTGSGVRRLIRSRANGRWILTLLGLLVVLTPVLAVAGINMGEPSPGGRLWYTAEEAYLALDAQGESGRQYHVLFLLLDLLLIPVYVALYAATIAHTYQRLFGRSDRVARTIDLCMGVPLLAGLADYAENGALLALLYSYPEQIPALATVAGFLTAAKWTLVIPGFCLAASGATAVGIGTAVNVARRIRNRWRHADTAITQHEPIPCRRISRA
jgi:hypothetical protein